MKRFIKQTHIFVLSIITASLLFGAAVAQPVFAANNCGTETAIINCDNIAGKDKDTIEGSGVWSLLLTAITILTAGIGVVALAGIVYGSILYTSAGGSPEQVKKATTIITNVVIGIVAYAAMWSFLQYLIPGGIFS